MHRLALIHPDNLLGKELRDALAQHGARFQDIDLLTTHADEVGMLTEIGGRPAMVQALEPEALERYDAALLSGPVAANRPLLDRFAPSAAAVVVSPDAGEDDDGRPIVAGVNLHDANRGETLLSPHPAAVLLAHLLRPLQAYAPAEAIATVFEPASALSDTAFEELLGQARNLLAFQPIRAGDAFPRQLAFNLMPAEALGRAELAESAAGQLRRVLGESAPPVRLRLMQAGVFHSYAASVYVRLLDDPGFGTVAQSLDDHPVCMLMEDADGDALGPTDAAARDEVLVGSIRADGEGGYWLWAAMDNLTCGGARNALQILEAVGL